MKRRVDETHVSAYLDEMLSGREMLEVDEWLRSQPDLRAELDELRRLKAQLRRLKECDPPPEFWDRTHQRLRAFARLEAHKSARRQSIVRPLALSAVTILLLGLLGFAAVRLSPVGEHLTAAVGVQTRANR